MSDGPDNKSANGSVEKTTVRAFAIQVSDIWRAAARRRFSIRRHATPARLPRRGPRLTPINPSEKHPIVAGSLVSLFLDLSARNRRQARRGPKRRRAAALQGVGPNSKVFPPPHSLLRELRRASPVECRHLPPYQVCRRLCRRQLAPVP
jgi:hypothetical protein